MLKQKSLVLALGVLMVACSGSDNKSDQTTPDGNQQVNQPSPTLAPSLVPSPSPSITATPSVEPSPSVTQYWSFSTNIMGEGLIAPQQAQVLAGGDLEVNLLPAVGFELAAVTGCAGELVDNRYHITNMQADCQLLVSFAAKHYQIDLDATEGVKLLNLDQSSYAHGTNLILPLVLEPGYQLDNISGCGGRLDGGNYLVSNLTQSCTISVNASLQSYVITTEASNGQLLPSQAVVKHGQQQSFSLTANDGYRLESITGCGGVLSGQEYILTDVQQACHIQANYVPITFQVSTKVNGQGTLTPAATEVVKGGSLSLLVQPEAGYELADIAGCDGQLVANEYRISDVQAACQVVAQFKPNQFNISTKFNAQQGSVTPLNLVAEFGEQPEFVITPATGMQINRVDGCQGELTEQGFQLAKVSRACELSVTFSTKQVTAELTVLGENGTVTPATRVINYNTAASFTITPATNYVVDQLQGCGLAHNSGSTYRTEPLVEDCVATVSFKLREYDVSVVWGSGDNGSFSTVTPALQSIRHGDDAIIYLDPQEGYGFNNAIRGSSCRTDDLQVRADRIIVPNVTANCTITVTYRQIPVPIAAPSVNNHGRAYTLTRSASNHTVDYCLSLQPISDGLTCGDYASDIKFSGVPANNFTLDLSRLDLDNHYYLTAFNRNVNVLSVPSEPVKLAFRYQARGALHEFIWDKVNELYWNRCAIGQNYDRLTNRCIGPANAYAPEEVAELRAPAGFRLPSIDELQSLNHCQQQAPNFAAKGGHVCAANTQVQAWFAGAFPNMSVALPVISSSVKDGKPQVLDPVTGQARFLEAEEQVQLRWVLDQDPIDDRFLILGEREDHVLDIRSSLVWSRCALGQTWAGSQCSGTRDVFNFVQKDDALVDYRLAGYNDWRLPAANDILSIIRCDSGEQLIYNFDSPQNSFNGCRGGNINPIIFAGIGTRDFWAQSITNPVFSSGAMFIGSSNNHSSTRSILPVRNYFAD